VLSLFSAPRIDMREDYEKVRRAQRLSAALPSMRYRPLDLRAPGGLDGGGVPVRVFNPPTKRREQILLFFHGGGWVTGDIESYTPACATMAELTGAVVVSVDYRLAPEHSFPAGLEDCFQVARLLMDYPAIAGIHGPEELVIIGDSAGGNLTAAVNLMLQRQGYPAAGQQILLYPVTHWDHDPATSPFDSVRDLGTGERLTSLEIEEYMELYVPDPAARTNPLVAPLLAPDLSAQPEALVLTAERDLLRDEGEAFGRALTDAGVGVRIHRVPDAAHGFITLPRFSRPLREAYEFINDSLDHGADGARSALATQQQDSP
jgi:acetyl esterase/lipase